MKCSQEGLALIKKFEGCKLKAYKCSAGVWTIGYGHTAGVKEGDVLVADMTDPDWEPVMKRASGIITNRGGRTCHAAIIARELGIPAIVGTNNACLLYTSPSPRDRTRSRMPSSA